MNTYSKKSGQTLIETAFALLILLVLTLGAVEFARAWYVKNSLKNAVRQGARVVAVTPNTPTPFITSFSCTSACPNTNNIIDAVCCQPGVTPPVEVTVTCSGSTTACGSITAGDTVTVQATKTFLFIIGGSPWPWPGSTDMVADASMRYE
jgi:Flp pilus assembly protein TadG